MLEIELVQRRIDALNTSLATTAALAGVGESKTRAILNGTRPDNDALKRLNSALDALEQLVNAAKPLKLDLKNAAVARDLLDRFQTGKLTVAVESASGNPAWPKSKSEWLEFNDRHLRKNPAYLAHLKAIGAFE